MGSVDVSLQHEKTGSQPGICDVRQLTIYEGSRVFHTAVAQSGDLHIYQPSSTEFWETVMTLRR